MKKRILALLLTLALVLPAVSCDVLLADPNGSVTPSDSQSESNNNTPDTERVPSKGPEVHTQPETPPDSEPPVEWPDEPQDSEQIDPPVDPEPETEYIPKEFKVTFMLEGYDHEYGIQFVKEGNTVGKPQVSIDPAIGSFDGIWYTDPHFKQVFDFGTYIAGDITLFGRFVPNPAAPALLITPEQLAEQASEVGGYAQGIASADVMTNGSNSFVRLTASNGDPYFMAAQNCGKMPDYLVIRYRTNSEIDGEMFIGSGNGPHGVGDHCNIEWNGDNEWHLAIIHLPSCGASTIKNGVIDYLRIDFFRHFIEGDYIDFAYIAFFNSAEYAEAYDLEHYPPYIEKEAAGMKAHSFDTFFANGEMYFEQDGAAGDKLTAQENKVVFKTGETAQSIALRGWIGFEQPFVSFGYYVDGYEFVWDDFTQDTEYGVLAAGGEFASRYCITVPLADLATGEHMVGFVIKLEDGTVVRLREELTVVIENTKWDENRDIVVHQSFDQLYAGTGNAGLGPENVFAPGQSAIWDFVATLNDFAVDTLTYWGWIAYMGELGQFGYQINGGTPIYNETFAIATEQPVIDASKGTGADSGSRMKIAISLAGLEGTNTVTVLYKNAEGKAVVLNEFTVILPNEYIVGLNKETGGHIQNGDQAVYDQGSSFGYIGTKVANPGKLSGTIAIDGIMDVAYGTYATFLTLPHQMGADNGNTAFAWVTYDDAYIYTFVEVTDWTLDASAGFIWQKDSVSFITDFNYNRDVEEYTGEGMVYATIAIDGNTAFYHETANGVPYAVVVDEENNKYYVEIAMPILDSFNGEYLGYEITICDAVNGTQIGGYSWNISGVLHAWHYTHVCGTLNLAGVEVKDYVGLNKEEGGEIDEDDDAIEDNGQGFGYLGTKVANPGKLSGTIEIDGVMDMAYMTSATFLTLPHQMGTDNGNTAFAWVTYDDAYIYTFVEVTDWTLDASAGFVWQKDSVSFITDFNYNRDVEEYTGEGMGYATIAIDGITAFYHETANGVPYAVVVDEENNKYYVEIAMPILDSFNDEYLGYEITICDAANGAQIGGYSWNISGVLHAWHYTHVCGTLNLHNVKA